MKTIIVTGGAQGIGKGITLSLLNAGYQVSVWDIDAEANQLLTKELNNNVHLQTLTVDVANEANVQNAVNATIKRFSTIYGLINNAGISKFTDFEKLKLDEWNRIITVNLTSIFICSQNLLPFLKESKGVIVNMASTRALQSEPNNEVYAATKGGILALTHALGNTLGPTVRVNCISPGWIDTAQHQKTKQNITYSELEHSQHPCGRIGIPNDIANMILFLLNSDNSFITGQNFCIDGGMTHKMIYF
jgi:NAD(P)-dependent dehydrogenase (short-subunit alcohol dehydrogenase family)